MTITKRNNKSSMHDIEKFRGQLLNWYDENRRILPWRALPGQVADPYHVWLSEIMLQQTTVGAVIPYFLKFTKTWPDVHALAAESSDVLMAAWAGLGYYARARNLHACAKIVANDLDGVFPNNQAELKKLPGIGDYTSAAITAIAFNKPATVVDGNVDRVMARTFAVEEPMPKSKPQLKAHAAKFFDGYTDRPGDLAQAFMDLGAGTCIAKTPRCALCPVSDHCVGLKLDIAATLPRKAKKKPKPQRHGDIYWITNDNAEALLHRRPDKGLLGGTLALPTTEWIEKGQGIIPLDLLKDQNSTDLGEKIHHSFTQIDLELPLKTVTTTSLIPSKDHQWRSISGINAADFPTVFKKAVKLFLK